MLTFGFPVADFTRLFTSYSYQVVNVDQVNTEVLTPVVLASNPFRLRRRADQLEARWSKVKTGIWRKPLLFPARAADAAG